MMSCRKSARLMSEQCDRSLTMRERLLLRMHMLMCGMCRIYAVQLTHITRVCREAGARSESRCPGSLSEERKRRIREAMERSR